MGLGIAHGSASSPVGYEGMVAQCGKLGCEGQGTF